MHTCQCFKHLFLSLTTINHRQSREHQISFTCFHLLSGLFLESELPVHFAKVARWRWFSRVAFKSTVQPQVLKRRRGTKWFNAGTGCTHKTLHLHSYIRTCDLESIFTPKSLAWLGCTSVRLEWGGLARIPGKCRGRAAELGVWIWLGRLLQPFIKAAWQEWGWVGGRGNLLWY